MTCVICKHGTLTTGTTTLTLERGGTTLVFKGVPALVCDTCGEAYVDAATSTHLFALAEAAAAAGVQVEVRAYAEAA